MLKVKINDVYYLNKKFSYPIKIIGIIELEGEHYLITKATKKEEEDNEVVVRLLKCSTLEKGLENKTYTLQPLKPIKEKTTKLEYEDSTLIQDVYEVAYDDALVDLGLMEDSDRGYPFEEDDIPNEEKCCQKDKMEKKHVEDETDETSDKTKTNSDFQFDDEMLRKLLKTIFDI